MLLLANYGFAQLPEITAQPESSTLCTESYALFKVEASNATAYQWFLSTDTGETWQKASDNNLYNGTQTNTLEVIRNKTLNKYMFRCSISNENGEVTSQPATLYVPAAFEIIEHPESVNTCEEYDSYLTLSVKMNNAGDYTYKWYKDNNVLADRTNADLYIEKQPENSGQYFCFVTNVCGSVLKSNNANVTIPDKDSDFERSTLGERGFSGEEVYDASINFDQSNTPFVSYSASNNNFSAKVMFYDGNKWTNFSGDGFVASSAIGTKITFDNNNTPYLSYKEYDLDYSSTIYKYNGTSWERLGDKGFSKQYITKTCIPVFDKNNVPYVALNTISQSKKIMKYNGTNWEDVGQLPESIANSSNVEILADNDGQIYVASATSDRTLIEIHKYNGNSWEKTSEINGYNEIGDFIYKLDNSGIQWIAFRNKANFNDYSLNMVTFKKFVNNEWIQPGSKSFTNVAFGYEFSLGFDNDNTPYFGYDDALNCEKFTIEKFNGTDWIKTGEMAFTRNGYAQERTCAIDNSGNAYVATREIKSNIDKFCSVFNLSALPTILKNPESKEVPCKSEKIIFTANAENYDSIQWQTSSTNWDHDFHDIENSEYHSGAKTTELTVSFDENYNNRYFRCAFYNSAGKKWTSSAFGAINSVINAQPFSKISAVEQDSSIILKLNMSNENTHTYQWYKGNETIDGATNSQLAIETQIENAGYYHCDVKTSCGDEFTSELSEVIFSPAVEGSQWRNVGTPGFYDNKIYIPKIRIDKNNVPYVAFKDGTEGIKITVMRYINNKWQLVGDACFTSEGVNEYEFGLDAANAPLVAYTDKLAANRITVKKFDGNNWIILGKTGFTNTASDMSMAFDNEGMPYVVISVNNVDLEIWKYTDTNWELLQTDEFAGISVSEPNITFTENNTPVILYRDTYNANQINVKSYNGSGWDDLNSDAFIGLRAQNIKLLSYDNSTLYVAFVNLGNNYQPTIMKYQNGNWEKLNTNSLSFNALSGYDFTVDKSGVPHVAAEYYNNLQKASVLKYDGSDWGTVGQAGFSAHYISGAIAMSFDNFNIPYVIYDVGALLPKVKRYYKQLVRRSNSKNQTGICEGTDVQFGVEVLNASKYQWQYSSDGTAFEVLNNGNGFAGSNQKTLNVTVAKSMDNYRFRCIAYGYYNDSIISEPATLTIHPETLITLQPSVGAIVCEGDEAIKLSTETNKTDNVEYQWFFDEAILAGANNKQLIIETKPENSGIYYCIAGDKCKAQTDNSEFIINPATKITSQPTASLTANQGSDDIKLSVEASGTGEINYQWYNSSGSIEGETNSVLTIKTHPDSSGEYFCIVESDCGGQVKSTPSEVEIVPAVKITKQPEPYTITFSGDTDIKLSVEAGGFGVRTYQWYKDNEAITGKISTVLIIKAETNNSGDYYCVIKSSEGDDAGVKSRKAQVIIESEGYQPKWENVGNLETFTGKVDYASFAFDNDGIIYAAYKDENMNGKLSVVRFDGKTWEYVGQRGITEDKVGQTSICIDNKGIPYVAFQDWQKANKASVVRFNGETWKHAGNQGFTPTMAENPILKINSENVPYLAFTDYVADTKISVMKFTTGKWDFVGDRLFANGGTNEFAFEINNKNIPYILFADHDNDKKASVMRCIDEQWSIVGTSGFSEGGFAWPSIKPTETGVYVAFNDNTEGGRISVYQNDTYGTEWKLVGEKGFSIGWSNFSSMTIGKDAKPIVAYRNELNDWKAEAMKFNGTSWDTLGNRGFSAAAAHYIAALTDNGYIPHVAYTEWDAVRLPVVMKYLPVPFITKHIIDTTVCEGQIVDLKVDSNPEYNYRWQKSTDSGTTYNYINDNDKFTGTNTYSLAINNIAIDDSVLYRCIVENVYGKVAANAIKLHVKPGAKIITHPVTSTTTCEGEPEIELSIETDKKQNVVYQWYKDNAELSDANTSILKITTEAENSGVYYCIVSSGCGDIKSNEAKVALYKKVEITAQPSSQDEVISGESAGFEVVATGHDLTYQWLKNEVALADNSNISGTNTAELKIVSASTDNEGEYYCIVKNYCNIVVSDKVSLTIKPNRIEALANYGISVYPNPSEGIFTIKSRGKYKLVITDISGKTIKEKYTHSETESIDISSRADGIYFLTISNKKIVKTVKLIKR